MRKGVYVIEAVRGEGEYLAYFDVEGKPKWLTVLKTEHCKNCRKWSKGERVYIVGEIDWEKEPIEVKVVREEEKDETFFL